MAEVRPVVRTVFSLSKVFRLSTVVNVLMRDITHLLVSDDVAQTFGLVTVKGEITGNIL
jgi:hypothetical protein